MIKCCLCGKEFKDNAFDEYAAHTQKCAYNKKIQADTEKMKKINEELEEVKRAKVCYEGLRDTFKKKYPDIYKSNFPEEITSKKINPNNSVDNVNKDFNRNKCPMTMMEFFNSLGDILNSDELYKN